MHRKGTETLRNAKCQTLLEEGIKTELNARLAIWQRADLFMPVIRLIKLACL